jgi:hypothetical protein
LRLLICCHRFKEFASELDPDKLIGWGLGSRLGPWLLASLDAVEDGNSKIKILEDLVLVTLAEDNWQVAGDLVERMRTTISEASEQLSASSFDRSQAMQVPA